MGFLETDFWRIRIKRKRYGAGLSAVIKRVGHKAWIPCAFFMPMLLEADAGVVAITRGCSRSYTQVRLWLHAGVVVAARWCGRDRPPVFREEGA